MKEVITKKQILWEELTTPNRTIDHQVTQTREKITDGSKQGTPYANFWDPELKYEDEELVRNALNLCRDHLVLDLGCGGQKRDSDYPSKEPKFLEVLRKEKISGVRYIGVDSFIIQECPNPWEDTETAERWGLEVTSEITPSVHKIDLLEALYHIKDTCEVHKKPLCIVMNGIDEDIIFDAPWEAIYQEIKRRPITIPVIISTEA